MKYKHVVVPLAALHEIARKNNVPVGEDIVEHFLNDLNQGRRVVGFTATISPDKMPHYHFIFEEGGLVQ